MMQASKTICWLGLLLVLLVTGGCDRGTRPNLVGERAPDFTVQDSDRIVSLHDVGHGKIVILNFWATWCTPCTLEMPTLQALWMRYRERGLTVAAVSVDRGAPRDLIAPYVRSLKLTFPILLDPEAKTAGAWRVSALPATFVIKPGGEVVGFAMGAREWDSPEMRALLEPLLPRHHEGR